MGLFSRKKEEPKPAPKAQPVKAQPAPVAKPAPPKASETAQSKDDLEKKIALLDKRADKLTKQISDELDKAKAFMAAGDERRAKACLTRKKTYETQLESNGRILKKYEQMLNMLDEAAINKVALDDIGKANDHIGKLQVDPERADDIMEKMNDNYMKQREINDILGQETGEIIDEDAELEELKMMMENDAALDALKQAPEIGSSSVPQHKVPAMGSASKAKPVEEEEDDPELAQLRKEMQAL